MGHLLVQVLFFRASREDLAALGNRHLALGLACVWLVGMGRYWDHPKAHALQYAGVGSVIYVFALSLLLWLIALPLKPRDWTYRRTLTFVALTSPPAALYAIPVERFLDLPTARAVNAWFLAVVAAWRVALYAFYLRRWGGLDVLRLLSALLLPLMLVVTVLTMLNLERAVFEIMASAPTPGTAHDGAYGVLIALTLASVYGILPVLVLYMVGIGTARRPPDS